MQVVAIIKDGVAMITDVTDKRRQLIQKYLFEGKSLREIGKELNISGERVRQLSIENNLLTLGKKLSTPWLCYLSWKFHFCSKCGRKLIECNGRRRKNPENLGQYLCAKCWAVYCYGRDAEYREKHHKLVQRWRRKHKEQYRILQRRGSKAWHERNKDYLAALALIKKAYPATDDPKRIELITRAQKLKVYVRGPFKHAKSK